MKVPLQLIPKYGLGHAITQFYTTHPLRGVTLKPASRSNGITIRNHSQQVFSLILKSLCARTGYVYGILSYVTLAHSLKSLYLCIGTNSKIHTSLDLSCVGLIFMYVGLTGYTEK